MSKCNCSTISDSPYVSVVGGVSLYAMRGNTFNAIIKIETANVVPTSILFVCNKLQVSKTLETIDEAHWLLSYSAAETKQWPVTNTTYDLVLIFDDGNTIYTSTGNEFIVQSPLNPVESNINV